MPPKVKQMIKEQQEQAIFKELEEFGWEYNEKPNNKMLFERYSQEYDSYDFILIHKETKTYTSNSIDMKTHQLLHRLFEIWGWFDE